ncbi:MAG: hypothetical protein QOI95_505 [Acidimicrobiaceae bacterium]
MHIRKPLTAVVVGLACLLQAPVASSGASASSAAPSASTAATTTSGVTETVVDVRPADGTLTPNFFSPMPPSRVADIRPGWQTTLTSVPGQMVTLSWPRNDAVELSIRSRNGSQWSSWVDAGVDPDERTDSNGPEHGVLDRTIVGPIWIGRDASALEVRDDAGQIGALRVHVLNAPASGELRPAGHRSVAGTAAATFAPGYMPRWTWAGPNEQWVSSTGGCEVGQKYASLKMAIVHHTVSTNDYSPADVPGYLRGIYYSHTAVNGWCDIAYNFVIDKYGTTWEARSGGANLPVIGGHAQGFNTGSVGISFLGQYQPGATPPVAQPSAAQLSALERLIAWKFTLHGLDPNGWTLATSFGSTKYPEGEQVVLAEINGHRDTSLTSCPGDYVYGHLVEIRNATAALMGTPGVFGFGLQGDAPVMGDWNGDGIDSPGVFRNGTWYLRNSNTNGPPDLAFGFGLPGDTPVVGDWNGDGVDTIGVFRLGRFYQRNQNSNGIVDNTFEYGFVGDRATAGDWNGDGIDTPGIYRNGTWFLRNANSNGPTDSTFNFGLKDDKPIVGDWDGDGRDTPAVRRGAIMYLTNVNAIAPPVYSWTVGTDSDLPVAGDWRGGGSAMVGLVTTSTYDERWDVVAQLPAG